MFCKRWCALAVAALVAGNTCARAQTPTQSIQTSPTRIVIPARAGAVNLVQYGEKPAAQDKPATQEEPGQAGPEAEPAEGAPLGPTPPDQVKILQSLLGLDEENPPIRIFGWLDPDYTYRSTGHGINNIAPVMNRFGDELLMRQIGLNIYKPLDPKDWSWGFNSILIAGSDAAFLNPTAGWFKSTDPRFGLSFTDLNVTAHLPILTEGGVDVKFGRQTTVLGPMGALPYQRYFDSSDYTWYNEEEGRYTGLSANWHISKWLSWYNGIELGGWGSFYDFTVAGPDYLGQINYWFDEDAKRTLLTLTVLTGPTGHFSNGNTTVTEVAIHQNWTDRLYQVIDTHLCYSKAPIFFAKPPGYQERSYSVYNYLGYHLSCTLDFNTRVEWYRDVDGGGYPGGFGIPKTNYEEVTLGFDYHPVKWLQLRPEIRGDFANHPAFGRNQTAKDQLSIAMDALIKF
jgi:Putative beta-barrel porin-2, OmpL-like. bbp2